MKVWILELDENYETQICGIFKREQDAIDKGEEILDEISKNPYRHGSADFRVSEMKVTD